MANFHNFSKPIVIGSLSSAPSSPENGAIYYNTTTNKFQVYQNGSWLDMTSTNGNATSLIVTDAATDANIQVSDGNLNIKTGTKNVSFFDTTNSESIDQVFYKDKVLVANTLGYTTIADINFDTTLYRSAIIEVSIKESTTSETMIGRIFLTAHGTSESSLSFDFTDTEGFSVLWDKGFSGNNLNLMYINPGSNDLLAHFLIRKFPL